MTEATIRTSPSQIDAEFDDKDDNYSGVKTGGLVEQREEQMCGCHFACLAQHLSLARADSSGSQFAHLTAR